jgi:hypothetical protein
LNTNQIARREALILLNGDGARSIVQGENSLVTAPALYMSPTMVIRVNRRLQCANPQNGWHRLFQS